MDDQEPELQFPDAPRSELDRALTEVVRSAERVIQTQGRLRSLLVATSAVSDGLELPQMLRRITRAAMDLVGARYGALGVIAPDGSLEQFVHVGMPDDQVSAIGQLPEGHGLLGALIEEQVPIRLDHLRDDPRSSGFPQHHPPMESFLGVPIRVRGETFGNLYLTDRLEGSFTEEDQELLVSLASSAAVAIENARLYEQARRRQAWTQASAEFSSVLLSGDADGALALLAERCVEVADAALVCIVLPDGDELRVHVARGPLAGPVEGLSFPAAGTLAGAAIDAGQPAIDPGGGTRELPVPIEIGPAMALPLRSTPAGIPGAITVARPPHAAAFLPEDVDMATDFADQVSIALELARSLVDRQRLDVLDERARIARDLHDHVIQRLFATGLGLQALAARVDDTKVSARIIEAVREVNDAIADIRTAIFAMKVRGLPALRHRILDLVNEYSAALGFTPRMSFSGPVDLVVDEALADDAAAVVREGLSNALRHAEAHAIEVQIDGSGGELSVTVRDDGVGLDADPPRSSGLSNLRRRARARSGSFTLVASPTGGTELRWRVPTGAEPVAVETV